jgi:heptaprenyl diphosphate synthase
MNTRKLLLLSVMIALGIVLNWMENLFFPWTVLPVPGAKIGLANSIFLIFLLIAGFKLALTLSLVRVVLLAFITGTIATVVFPLSIGGAVLSIGMMAFSRWLAKEKLSLIGISIIGAVGHNLGQMLVLSFMPALFPGLTALYIILPGLLVLSVPAGMVTGWIAAQLYPVIAKEWEEQ